MIFFRIYMKHNYLDGKSMHLVGRSLLELVGNIVTNIRLCNWQCIHRIISSIKISGIRQIHGDLDVF